MHKQTMGQSELSSRIQFRSLRRRNRLRLDVGRKDADEGGQSRGYLSGPRSPGIWRLDMSITGEPRGALSRIFSDPIERTALNSNDSY